MEKSPLKGLIARGLIRCGISADFLTFAGLAMSFYAAWLILDGRYFAAGAALLFSGLLDMLDGAVARESGKKSDFGGILDSSLDRYGDGAVLCAALVHCLELGHKQSALLAASALLGSFGISYVRARAECETEDCRTGFWERGERLVVIALSLLLNNLAAALWLLGIGTHWTVLQRLLYARVKTHDPSKSAVPAYLKSSPRSAPAYYLKVAILLLLLFFWRPVY